MRAGWTIAIGLALAALAPATAHGAETRYSLAGGCFAVKSTDTGAYVSRSGPTRSLARAEPFRMKASRARAGTCCTAPRATTCARGPAGRRSPAGRRCGRSTRACARGAGATRSSAPGSARASPRPAPAPARPAFRGATRLGEVSGTLDAHGHLTAYEFIGGKFHCGKPFSPLGIQDALPDCSKDRGPNGSGAPLQNLLDTGSPAPTMDQVGFPTFKDWPSAHALTYEGTYWKWVERTWRSGTRMIVTLLVDNDVLCGTQSNRVNSCNEMDGAKLQRKRLYEMQDYIDAQYGGPGKGFLRVVTDPFQARRVVADGKLAVVMGMETSAVFDCRGNDQNATCDRAQIDRGLGRVPQAGRPLVLPRAQVRQPARRHEDGRRHHRRGGQPGQQARLRQLLGRQDVHRPRDRQHADRQRRGAGGSCGRHPAPGLHRRPDPGLPAGPPLQRARAHVAGPVHDRQARGLRSRSWRSTTWVP